MFMVGPVRSGRFGNDALSVGLLLTLSRNQAATFPTNAASHERPRFAHGRLSLGRRGQIADKDEPRLNKRRKFSSVTVTSNLNFRNRSRFHFGLPNCTAAIMSVLNANLNHAKAGCESTIVADAFYGVAGQTQSRISGMS